MKKILLLLLGISLLNSSRALSQATVPVQGVVKDKASGQPIPGVTIRIVGTSVGIVTNADGAFKLNVPVGGSIVVGIVGYTNQTMKIDQANDNLVINMADSGAQLNEMVVVGEISNKSYWSGASMGASIGYNVNASNGGTNNIVGGATVIINPMSDLYAKTEFAIVGNIANYMNTLSTKTTNTDLSKLAQDNNGLSVGIGGTREFLFDNNKLAFRIFGYTLYQLNSFQKTGDTTTTALSQWKNTLGLELEGFKFKQGGVLTFGVAGSYGIFDSNAYQKVFGAKKSAIASLETNVILPLSNQFGFMFSGTYSHSFAPVFLLGIIIKTIDFSKTTIGAAQHK